MQKFLTIAVVCLSLSACTTMQQGAAVGAGAGALFGAATTGTVFGTAVGAGIGGVVGAAAGDLLGKLQGSPGKCVYQRPNGTRYIDLCPGG